MRSDVHITRLWIFLFLLLVGALSLVLRMVYIGVGHGELRQRLLELGEKQSRVIVPVSASRRGVRDRYGRFLAFEIQKPSFFSFRQRLKDARAVRRFLRIPPTKWRKLVGQETRGFVWLDRLSNQHHSCAVPDYLKEQLFCVYEPARSYPWGEALESVIGRVGTDNQGLSGLEWLWNNRLIQPTPPYKYQRNARGELSILTDSLESDNPNLGSITISVDAVLQERLYDELLQEKNRIQADSAGALLVDGATGEILSLVSLGSHNRLSPLSDYFEWGSIMKPLLVACSLEEQVIRPEDKWVGGDSQSFLGGRHIVRDTKPREIWTLQEAIRDSSNLVMVQILNRLGVDKYWNCLEKYGFWGASPVKGALSANREKKQVPRDPWVQLTLAFGQGVSSTLAHYIRAFLAVISDRPLSEFSWSLDFLPPERLRSPLPDAIRLFMVSSLRSVVQQGTARVLSKLPLFVYGKTSTAQIYRADLKAYKGQLLAFVGAFGSPPYVLGIYLVKNEEQPGLYGGNTAAVVFKKWLETVWTYPYWPRPVQFSPTPDIQVSYVEEF